MCFGNNRENKTTVLAWQQPKKNAGLKNFRLQYQYQKNSLLPKKKWP